MPPIDLRRNRITAEDIAANAAHIRRRAPGVARTAEGLAPTRTRRGAPQRLPKLRPGVRFLGPMPMPWFFAAGALPGKAAFVGCVLWQLAAMERSLTVRLSGTSWEDSGIHRLAVYRGLAALEQAGFVSVDRKRGRNPIVTLLDPLDLWIEAPRPSAPAKRGAVPHAKGRSRKG